MRILFLLGVLLCASCGQASAYLPQDGDLIFHTSRSAQSQAIQRATHSAYSHMGMVLYRDGHAFVLEAGKTVQWTPLEQWIARGNDGHYVVKRLRDADALLTTEARKKLRSEALRMQGKRYDAAFGWSDERIYCSELVWKAYQRALGLRIGELQKLREFDLSDVAVQAKLKERYGNQVPMNEDVISPAAMFASPLLIEVERN
jgi:uncharacterized protein YycO